MDKTVERDVNLDPAVASKVGAALEQLHKILGAVELRNAGVRRPEALIYERCDSTHR